MRRTRRAAAGAVLAALALKVSLHPSLLWEDSDTGPAFVQPQPPASRELVPGRTAAAAVGPQGASPQRRTWWGLPPRRAEAGRRRATAESTDAPPGRLQGFRRRLAAVAAAAFAKLSAKVTYEVCYQRNRLAKTASSRKGRFLIWSVTSLVVFLAIEAVTGGPLPLTMLLAIPKAIGRFIITELSALDHLIHPGLERDVVGLLAATAVVVPIMKKLGTSPIIGFLLMGLLLGPSGIDFIHNDHEAHLLAEFGIVFFLFEMGLELSVAKVLSMKFDVFGLGFAQFAITGLAVGGLVKFFFPWLPVGAVVTLGGALALSTSAFVLQLIKDKNQLGARYGRASMGVLLFQDMAVVPLLVVVPLLSGAGGDLMGALAKAGARSILALGTIVLLGRLVLNKVFNLVNSVNSVEAFLSVTFATVLLSAAITEGLGLSNTLGAFFGGMLLAETSYRHQIESAIEPFRGMLLGLFFVTVGFDINLSLLAANWTMVIPGIIGLLVLKAGVILAACKVSGVPDTAAVRAAALLAPGGEFAFVAFGLAERLGLLPKYKASLLITSVAVSMALTPLLGKLGDAVAQGMAERRATQDVASAEAKENETLITRAKSTGFIAMCGYGRVGKVVCEVLDSEGAFNYIALDSNPAETIKARAAGFPVFLADYTKTEVLKEFGIKDAQLVIIDAGSAETTTAVTKAVKEVAAKVPTLVRATEEAHRDELEALGATVIMPKLPSQDELLSLPFSCAVLRQLGLKEVEIDGLMEEHRRHLYNDLPGRAKSLLGAFQLVDTDGSGMLDPTELRRALQNLGKTVTDEEMEEVFRMADLDENGLVDYEEFLKMRQIS